MTKKTIFGLDKKELHDLGLTGTKTHRFKVSQKGKKSMFTCPRCKGRSINDAGWRTGNNWVLCKWCGPFELTDKNLKIKLNKAKEFEKL